MNKITVDPSLLRKYFYEFVVIALTGAIVFLFWEVLDLHKFIRNDLINGRLENTRALDRNTNVIQESNYLLKQYKNEVSERTANGLPPDIPNSNDRRVPER